MQRLDPAGRIVQTEIYDGRFLKTPKGEYACPAALEGVVEAVDYVSRKVVVRLAAPASSNLASQTLDGKVGILYPENGGRSSVYRIEQATLAGTCLSFVSPLSLIRSDALLGEFSNRPVREIAQQEVRVDIVPGDRFRLPLAVSFER
jgi:hypothetical protein